MKTQLCGELYNQGRGVALPKQLLGHLIGDDPAKAVPSKAVRPFRLHLTNLGQLVSCDLLERSVLELAAIHSLWLDSIKRLAGIHFRGQAMHEQRASGSAVDAEKRRPSSGFLHRNQCGIVGIL